jgi:phosphodiesterase/alkaline phosphatase D-like protein
MITEDDRMADPLLTIVGHTTSDSTRIFCCTESTAAWVRVAWRDANGGRSGHADVALDDAPPYRIGTVHLADLPTAAALEYAVEVAPQAAELTRPDALLQDAPSAGRLRLLPTDRPIRIGFVSCNGAFQIEDEQRRYLLWRSLKSEIDNGRVDLLIHGGDQIYADPIWMRHDSDAKGRNLDPNDALRVAEVTQRYREWYIEKAWSWDEVKGVLAAVPNVMTWDDHDIFDGWGSHDNDVDPPQQAFFAAARQAFSEFQASHGPGSIGKTFLTGFVHGSVGVVLLDTRSHRQWSRATVLGQEQCQQLGAWSAANITDDTRRLFVVSSIPLVHAKVAGALTLLRLWPGTEESEDDLRDAWTASRNRGDAQFLCKWLFSMLHRHPNLQITILSGDVHVAAIAELESRLPAHVARGVSRIFQVTSSGIGHPPPTGFDMWLIRRALATRWMDLGSNDFRGRLLALHGATGKVMEARNFAVLTMEDQDGGWEPHGNLYVDLHVENARGTGTNVFRQVLNGPGRVRSASGSRTRELR